MRVISTISLLVCLASNAVFSQMYVGANSYVFNRGSLVYIKGDLELNAATSTFYLRNEGQLVQGTTGTSTNRGSGSLSVFQEGTSNQYRYNYWCSPVGEPSATSGNSMFGVSLLHQPTSVTASTPAIMVSTSYNAQSNPLQISTAWIYRFLSATTYSQWQASGSSTNIEAGQGFTMKGTNGSDFTNVGEAVENNPYTPGVFPNPPAVASAQRYDFRGKPNDGNITVNLAASSSTLTGNPYPSALDLNAFLLDTDNFNCTGEAYFWDQEANPSSHNIVSYVGGYGTYVPMAPTSYGLYTPATYQTFNLDGTVNNNNAGAGLPYERRFAPIGQGFLVTGVASLVAPNTVTLKNSHRAWYTESLPYSQFAKSGSQGSTGSKNLSETPSNEISFGLIRLKITMNNLYSRELALALSNNATDGVDRGMDGKSPDVAGTATDSYFFLDNTQYVIQSIPFDVTKRIKLGVKVTSDNTNFSFSLKQVQDFDTTQPIYIYDALDNSYHSINQNPYNVVLQTGENNNRFEVTFQNNSLNVDETIINDFLIIQNNDNQTLTVNNPNGLDIKSADLFDISGKLIFKKVDLGVKSSYEFSTSGLSDGVYIAKIISVDGKSKAQKVIIERRK
ncbi:T9SS type A sorting domain-containing protein [Flavobacterium aquatile]|uniref:Secretion system C-terminal sorting domain-containing protein n=1 Tax=Flavobacterium aquatile LMG 4008 = ATCC 11947 TaxID=1453498 RepID=A0A095SYP0_9FLAO|nr:T9SS type A sorting domain-containing protein [Flavobacterium aquatile]KGD69499.1 hypothetical protein LG45_01665 [Flavobacterium aquatile LMG 4008 = ATCC 11947]OXA66046.1 T9SS C-terminal target domain-containing protein [Flavobacterium aquatile LMG 4008 = ATCC 11947]GEC77523.1 T9SS C-terminal target domain-containing protein [Flavobacterium aquatile]